MPPIFVRNKRDSPEARLFCVHTNNRFYLEQRQTLSQQSFWDHTRVKQAAHTYKGGPRKNYPHSKIHRRTLLGDIQGQARNEKHWRQTQIIARTTNPGASTPILLEPQDVGAKAHNNNGRAVGTQKTTPTRAILPTNETEVSQHRQGVQHLQQKNSPARRILAAHQVAAPQKLQAQGHTTPTNRTTQRRPPTPRKRLRALPGKSALPRTERRDLHSNAGRRDHTTPGR